MMTQSGSSPVMARIVEKRSALEGARRVQGPLTFGDGPGNDFEFGEVDTDLLDRLLAEEAEDPPAERIRRRIEDPDYEIPGSQSPVAYEQALTRAHQGIAPLPQWEELTQTDSGYLLRHDGKLFAAVEVDAGGVVERAFGSKPKRRADSPPAPASKPARKRNAKGHYEKADETA